MGAAVAALVSAIGGWAWWRARIDDTIVLTAATFSMGSEPGEIAAAVAAYCPSSSDPPKCRAVFEREQPRHKVTVSRFRIDRTEVTYARFSAWLERQAALVDDEKNAVVIDHDPVVFIHRAGDKVLWRAGLERVDGQIRVRAGFERHPVAYVTWYGADRFCRDHGGRLPTEAEWERAARGVERRHFPWGDDEPRCGGVAFARGKGMVCEQRAGEVGTDEVGAAVQDVTPEGISDLGGSVAEWVADAFQERYAPCSSQCVDPRLDQGSGERVVRGGVWSQEAGWLRGAGRGRSQPEVARADLGFRCVKPAL
jgi:formylglycine-generating enzyme required for sulfatase activity